MKLLIAGLIICCSFTLFADNRLAIINDPDGYTNVRNGPGKSYRVIDTLFEEDFFYFQIENNAEWVKISAWRGRQIEGYAHISKIREVEKLDNHRQKELITKTLNRYKSLADNFQNNWKSMDTLTYNKSIGELEYYSDAKYDPVLSFVPKYFCATGDSEVMRLLLETMWSDKNSANETPSFALGSCYICRSGMINTQISKITDIEHKRQIYDQIEWGLLNQFQLEEDGSSTNKEFVRLKAILDGERKKAGLGH